MPPPAMKNHFVAFLDILGFKEMVESDMRGQSDTYMSKLFKCHQSAAQIFANDPSTQVSQFSDSIVISRPFSIESFEIFADHIAQYQLLLLQEGLVCRGGVAVNKHFSNGSFTFSAGLIEAYRLESRLARYPRVVVSNDVMDLIFPVRKAPPKYLIQEDDGLHFIDYLGRDLRRRRQFSASLTQVVGELLKNKDPNVREKGLWLAAYADAVLGTSLSIPKFVGVRV